MPPSVNPKTAASRLRGLCRRALATRREARYAPFLLHHRRESLAPVTSVAGGTKPDDEQLVERIVAAYRAAVARTGEEPESLWTRFFDENHRPIHEALLAGEPEQVARLLRSPGASQLFYGFDALTVTRQWYRPYRSFEPVAILDKLVRFAEAIGALRLDNPEAYHLRRPRRYAVDDVVAAIDDRLGRKLTFPNPFPGERGLASARGVISLHSVWSLYQGWRLSELAPGPRVLEIGAGLGRTAYYARQFGLTDYTIVDLPFTGVSSAYFLARTLGAAAVSLYGEQPRPDAVKILPPRAFFDGDDRFDVAFNADSLTEMARSTAEAYTREIARRTTLFVSINHEANEFDVRDLIDFADRQPHWLREGYVEEIVRF
jgi:hypothetical protein